MNLTGQILQPVKLRFNSSSNYAKEFSPMKGIKTFGPYDANLLQFGTIRCGVIYPKTLSRAKDSLVDGLMKGDGNVFPGFETWFKVEIKLEYERPLANTDPPTYIQAASDLVSKQCDLAFVLTPQQNKPVYGACKGTLLGNGIPCQFVTANKLADAYQRPWVIANIALACYAKVGGTPWVVSDVDTPKELVMGVSRAQDEQKKYVVGFVTIFNQEGDFLFLSSKTPVIEWAKYVEGLESLVVDAYTEYTNKHGTPQSLAIHFHKRPGHRELEAVNKALSRVGKELPYALLHLNEFSSHRLFDTEHGTFVPDSGLKVELSRHRALLLLDGLEWGKRNRMGVPNVWEINLDRRSTMDWEEFPRLVRQVHRFARVNWRGFNARAVPVTVNYSKLICDLVLEIGMDRWNDIIAGGKLRDKAWFL